MDGRASGGASKPRESMEIDAYSILCCPENIGSSASVDEKRKEIQMNRNNYSGMLHSSGLYEEAQRRYLELSDYRMRIESELRKAPNGIIHVVNSGRRIQFYNRKNKTDTSGKYIRKSEKQIIRALLQKAYNEKALKLLNEEIGNLNLLQKRSNGISERIRKLYSDLPSEIKEYINPIDKSDEDFIADWMNIPYDGKEISEQMPVFVTERGERVRSKSELNIANKLAENHISYKYECPLILSKGTVIYPDFTIMDVKKRKEIYWEHRGMMDDREYARQAVFKMKSMMNAGIVIGKNLIITEETSANPLGTNEIDTMIAEYFC